MPLTQRCYDLWLPKFKNNRVDDIFHLKVVGTQLTPEHKVKYQK
jgi:hypothetical protein